MKRSSKYISLPAEVVFRLIDLLKKASRKKRLGVKERQLAVEHAEILETELERVQQRGGTIKLSQEIICGILRTLYLLLTDERVVKVLLNWLPGGSAR